MVNFDEIEKVINEVETIPPGKKYPKFVGPYNLFYVVD